MTGMPDEQPAEVLGVEETDLIISTSSFSSSSVPINATCIFFNASSDLSCVNTNLTGEADVVYPYKVRFTGGFVQLQQFGGKFANLCRYFGRRSFSSPTQPQFKSQVEQLAFLWVLLTIIVTGNSLVLATLLSTRTRRSRMNFFIMHLAAADLSVGLLSVSTDIVWKLTVTWEAGLLACKVIRFLQVVVTYASTYVLVALSIDRYDAITHPMNFTGSWKRAKFLVGAAWVLSIAFSVPIIFLYNTHVTEEYGTQCWIDFKEQWHWKVYMTLVAVSLFLVPAILIASCYTIIVITIWKKGKVMAPPTATQALLPRGGGKDKECDCSLYSRFPGGEVSL